MRRKLLILMAMLLVGLAVHIRTAQSQSNNGVGYFNNTSAWSGAAEICHIVKSQTAQPGANLALYGVHVANTSGSTAYAAIFPGTVAQPNNGTVIPGGGWKILTASDIDINTVQLGISNSGTGFTVCLSTTQGTYTATSAVGYFWALYVGFNQPTSTATPTATPT